MSPTAETLHLFRKDTRGLWKEICALVFLCAANAALGIKALDPGTDVRSHAGGAVTSLLIVGVFLLAARVVHAEALPGVRQYWLTRPLRRSSLFSAKLLFLIAFVHVPVALFQASVIVAAGFSIVDYLPSLLWNQLLFVFCLDAPALALAVLTPGLPSFATAALAILMLFQAIGQYWNGEQLTSVAWVADTLRAIVWLAAAGAVILLQYRTRSTLRASLVAVAGLALCRFGVGALVPWSTAWAVQRSLGGEPATPPSLIRTAGNVRDTVPGSQKVEALLQVVLPQLPGGAILEADILHLTITNDRGGRVVLPTPNIGRQCTTGTGECTFEVSTLLPRTFYEGPGYKAQIQYSGELFLTGYGQPSVDTMPESAYQTPWRTRDLTCTTRIEGGLMCQSPFRWPRDLISIQAGTDPAEMQFTTTQSHSPFPASVSVQPLEGHMAGFYRSGLGRTSQPRPVRLLRRPPLWHTSVRFQGGLSQP